MRRSRKQLLGLLLPAIFVCAGTFWAGTSIRSPSQAAATAHPPDPTPLVDSVSLRVVERTVDAVGSIAVPTVAVKFPAGTDSGDELRVITTAPPGPGSTMIAGDRIAGISGHPVIVLPGLLPAYRDLRRDDEGPDVVQLQAALASAHLVVPRSGRIDAATISAIERLFGRAGFPNEVLTQRGSPSAALGSSPDPSQPVSVAPQFLLSRSSLTYVPSLPATVAGSTGTLGGPAASLTLSLRAGPPGVLLKLAPDLAQTVQPGMLVKMTIDGRPVDGDVASVSPPPDDAKDGGQATCLVAPEDVLGDSATQTIQATIVIASSGRPVLAVPVSAVHSDEGGKNLLMLRRSDGQLEAVSVGLGMSGDGYVAVTPEDDGSLSAGQKVALQW